MAMKIYKNLQLLNNLNTEIPILLNNKKMIQLSMSLINNNIETYNKLLMTLNNSLNYLPYTYIDETRQIQMKKVGDDNLLFDSTRSQLFVLGLLSF